MALGTVTIRKQGAIGDLWYVIADVQPSSGANYTTGGETFAAAQVSRTGNLLGVQHVGGGSLNANRGVPVWDAGNKKLMMFRAVDATTVGLAEAASNSDFSNANTSVRLLCIGK